MQSEFMSRINIWLLLDVDNVSPDSEKIILVPARFRHVWGDYLIDFGNAVSALLASVEHHLHDFMV